jgi:potassium-dependent mechanosensitive channel
MVRYLGLSWASIRPPLLGVVLAGCLVGPAAYAQSGHARDAGTIAAAQAKPPATSSAVAPPADPRINTADISKRVNQELGTDLGATTAQWQRELDGVETALARPHLRYSELNALRDELQRARSAAAALSSHLQPALDAAKSQLDLLGPAPASGQPEEPEQTALSRAALNYHVGLLSGGQAAINAANLRIDQLLTQIQDARWKNFSSFLFQPIPGVYAYETWARLPEYVPAAISSIRNLIAEWWNGLGSYDDITRTAVEALLLCGLLFFVCHRGVRRLRSWKEPSEPPFWRKASAAAGVILLRAAPVAVPVMFLYAMVAAAQPLPERLDWLFYFAAQSVVIVFTVGALATTVFAPSASRWRLIPSSDSAAARLCGLITLLALVYSLTTLLYITTRLVQAPFALTIAIALPSNLLLAGLVVAILRTPLEHEQITVSARRWLQAIRMPVWAVVAAIVACALAGYLSLARFLAQQLVVTGSLLALVYLFLLWVDGFMQSLSDDGGAIGRWLGQKAGLERTRREQLALPVSLFLKFAVLLLSVPLIMLQWGYTWPDIEEWYRQLFFGFHIGETQVTFGALLASIIVFGLGYAAARLFQGWLDAQVLQRAGISGGVRHSIRTGVGYAGITIAGLMAFSYAGFSLSSIAIIAGALSIGIGFGLQNLVNNFVSGLILLAERPIRVGDLVVVNGEEGYVRKISVRSTEIETFDRAHVLIPNSYFISEKVKNWTYRNNVRRLAIQVGAAYGSDPRQVQAVLLKVAQDHPDVLKTPAPLVDLKEFAASSLSFMLYAYIDDLTKAMRIHTDLSMAILAAFAEAGIVMPTGQTDVTIRNADWLREAIAHDAPSLRAGSGNGTRPASRMPAPAE